MDPISIAASIVGLVEASSHSIATVEATFKNHRNFLEKIQPDLTKLQTALGLLRIISKHFPTNEVLPGVDLSLRVCMESCQRIVEIIHRLVEQSRNRSAAQVSHPIYPFFKELSREADVFADSVASLRTFSQEAKMEYMIMSMKKLDDMSQLGLQYQTRFMKEVEETKHDLLRHMSTIMDVFDKQSRSGLNIGFNNGAPSADNTYVAELLSQLKAAMDATRDNSDRRQEDLNEIRAQLERTFTQQQTVHFNRSDEFVYNISILSQKDGVQDAASSTHCRATLDTGCHDNWVSTATIERAGLLSSIGTNTDPEEFKSFSGHVMKPQGQIELTFFLAMASGSSQRTRTETFYVFDQLEVDLVLGKGFIAKQFTFVSKHALGLVKQGKFTQEEIRTIEASLREQGAANAEISSLRRAAGASAREGRRAQKAASRVTSRGLNTPFSGASGWSTPSHPAFMVGASTRRSSLMVPTSRLHISSTQVSEMSGSEDENEEQESEVEAGPSGVP